MSDFSVDADLSHGRKVTTASTPLKDEQQLIDALSVILPLGDRNDAPVDVNLPFGSDLASMSLEQLHCSALRCATEDHMLPFLPQVLSIAAQKISESVLIADGEDSDWEQPLHLLETNQVANGLKGLQVALKADPKNASLHYDHAVQVLVKQRVKSLLHFPKLGDIGRLDIPSGQWITVKCPARIDLQGGWSDTPPICYELGGKVLNVAILVNGQKPIGARLGCRSVALSEPLIVIRELGNDFKLVHEISIYSLADLCDYDQPFSPGNLVKAALVCTDIVDMKHGVDLRCQLSKITQGGLEIETWSNLPQGSGLGTSSILASAIIAVLWTATKRSFTKSDLIHATLYLEQVITTGGGWQDQVGGVSGGVNLGQSSSGNQ